VLVARLAPRAVVAVARRPGLWPTALAESRALVGPRWWTRWPPLPLPTAEYMSFRLQAMYGTAGGALSADEIVGYLEWCRRMRSLAR